MTRRDLPQTTQQATVIVRASGAIKVHAHSRDQNFSLVSIVDDVALDDERADAFAELGPGATHARLFGQELESIEDGVNESIGRPRAGVIGEVRLGKS